MVIEKINKMILRPCNMVYKVPLRINSYQEVLNEWKNYKVGRNLTVSMENSKLIMDLFKFHLTAIDHIILYYSANQRDCLLMCRVDNKVVNLSIPAYNMYDMNKSVVATYS